MRMRHIVIFGLTSSTIPHYPINGTILEEKKY
jgi:hypothetical protein